MNLLILLNGNADLILNKHNINKNDVKIIKVDEKKLASPGFILSLIKKDKYKKIYFACIELKLQRFHTFMKLYILLSFCFNGEIIDELGFRNKFSMAKLFFIEIPKLFYEIIASIFVIIYYYIKLPILKWKLKNN